MGILAFVPEGMVDRPLTEPSEPLPPRAITHSGELPPAMRFHYRPLILLLPTVLLNSCSTTRTSSVSPALRQADQDLRNARSASQTSEGKAALYLASASSQSLETENGTARSIYKAASAKLTV